VREAPGKNAAKAGTLRPSGNFLPILEYATVETPAGLERWARIGPGRWVDARYLSTVALADEKMVDFAVVAIQSGLLTVRSAPGADKA
jgi:hypothetical protein